HSWIAPLIERAPLPMVEVEGPEHLVCFTNPAFCRLVGKRPEELLGKPFAQIVRNGDKCVPLLDRVYQTGESEIHVDQDDSAPEPSYWLYAMWPALDSAQMPERVVIQLTKAVNNHRTIAAMNEALILGGLRQHELRAAAEQSNALLKAEIIERTFAGKALNQAIDALKIAQAAATRGNRAKDDFLAALSHELRTPLTPVLLAAAALQEDERLPADARAQLAMMERNIALEARLVDDLLDLTKIAHGKLEFRPEPARAHRLIAFAVDMIRDEAEAKGVSITCTLAAGNDALLADPVRFQQAIWNLLRNAVKFTPARGSVAVSTSEEQKAGKKPWLKIAVTDTGIGVPPERLQQIFLPFDQGGLAGDHRFGGVGLGLAIAQAIVDLHGGHISAQSAGWNQGTTFTIELPRLGTAVCPPVTPVPFVPGTGPAFPPLVSVPPLRLLLVEDHASTRHALKRLLERDGHTVVAAASVEEALQAASAHQAFDLVVSDLGLPDGSGLELMEKLRAQFGLRGVALTGYGSESDVGKSRQAGFISHLTKPVALADLRRALAAIPKAGPKGNA
ncbi:MAG: hypothetical protein JWQ62_811, partial [Lacunisphaera sp.]|nr:hypothetical protein [Lacunisphaera sp.]